MKKGGALYLFTFGLLLIILSIVFAFNTVSKSKTSDFDFEITDEESYKKKHEEPSTWSKLLNKKESTKDYYPANEILLSWDLVEANQKKDTLYKITFKKLDRYQYFCLLQVLNSNNIKRTIEKKDNLYKVYLNLYSKSAAEILTKELKEYDIDGKITKYKSKIKYE